jgi:hypothetical protein
MSAVLTVVKTLSPARETLGRLNTEVAELRAAVAASLGAEENLVSHGAYGWQPYPDPGNPGRWLVDVPSEVAPFFAAVGPVLCCWSASGRYRAAVWSVDGRAGRGRVLKLLTSAPAWPIFMR